MSPDSRPRTWATSDRFIPRTFVRPFFHFTQVEAASGIVLLVAAAVALIWANSSWAGGYHQLFQELHLEISFGPIHLDESFGELINDGLMAIFFFVVGLEIKRELVLGELRDPKAAALPILAALGGMLVPALIYVAFNSGMGPEALRGWGIPMATDIAFAVGVLALLGKRVPPAGKLFILALAIADDLGAILVIAIFYTADLSLGWLGLAIAGLATIAIAQRVQIRSLAFFIPVAVFVWFAMLESGVHATLAGVALGFLTPARALYSARELETSARQVLDLYPLGSGTVDEEKSDHEARLLAEIARESVAPLARLEHKLLPWSSFAVIPLFALANAGVSFDGIDAGRVFTHPVALGVAVGLVAGKTVGISAFAWLAVRLGLGRLPTRTSWRHVVGLAAVAGIGFTVSLFVTGLAFTSDEFTDIAKLGIFAGSAIAGVVGTLILLSAKPVPANPGLESAAA
ncbi:MAG TPA: Na+/H+ antiporter NhaA [Acidimicrobiia bacterium]|nr:Na+/H+ antiporter NhaA [Acidimicrobiia bacterium]